jgi:hypothetical protein
MKPIPALGIILAITLGTAMATLAAQPSYGQGGGTITGRVTGASTEIKAAPTAISGDNIYIAWWTNNTENGNEEVMFRASNDGGATFGDKMNLSNTPNADSWRVEIAGEGATVLVTWWETNQTSDTPVARLSTDGGATFGPMMMLATNGTISSTEDETTTADATAGEEGEGGE